MSNHLVTGFTDRCRSLLSLHPQIPLPEIPRLLRTDDLVDLRVVDVRLQIAVVAVPAQIFLAPVQPVPGRLHRGEEDLRWDCDYCNLQTDINNAEINQIISSEQA